VRVIKMDGWRRSMWFDETNLTWVNPSPNMRSLMAAGLYPGIGLLEAAISVGRGTPIPFEIAGAPYIDGGALARVMNSLRLPGIWFEPARFTPDSSVFANQPCGGVRMLIMNRATFQPVRTGLALAIALHRMYGDRFPLEKLDPLLRSRRVLDAIRAGRTLDEVVATYSADEAAFRERRKPFLLY
jgi:uncharacterized protein YbbC (DUF1343 family)